MPTAPRAAWTVTAEAPDSPAALALWRAYYTEVSDRWYRLHEGRDTDPAELEREIAAAPAGHLAPPRGRLLVGRYDGAAAGSAGVWLADPATATAELTRVYVRPAQRGTGGAPLLVAAAEDAARALGARRLRLDTRGDLVGTRTHPDDVGLTPPGPSGGRRAAAPRPTRTSPR